MNSMNLSPAIAAALPSMEQQPKRSAYNIERPTLNLTGTEAATEASGATGARIMPGSGSGAGSTLSPGSTTPIGASGNVSFLPEMPQWKKDLIQRRKTNVARTVGATSPNSAAATNAALTLASPDGMAAMTLNATTDSIVTEEAATKVLATATITSQEEHKQKYLKRNVNQTAFKATSTTTTAIAPEEKSEKCFIVGGHHTILTPTAVNVEAPASVSSAEPETATETAAPAMLSTTTSTKTGNTPIPKQRSSLFNATTTQAAVVTNTRSQSTSKEPENLNLTARECGERMEPVGEQQRPIETGMVNSRARGEFGKSTRELTTATTRALTTGSSANDDDSAGGGSGSADANQTVTTSSSANQLQTQCKVVQRSKFIKNKQQLELAVSGIGSGIKMPASPPKVAVKTTMAAMKEMKKSTKQNGENNRHQNHHQHQQHQHGTLNNGAQNEVVDTGEDLSYGPGIVSKLRSRYLSLALRESVRQEHNQNLRRSISLNTLHDREDNDEEEHEQEQIIERQQRPPPIGVKPTIVGSYIKSPHVAQRQVSGGSSNGNTTTSAPAPLRYVNISQSAAESQTQQQQQQQQQQSNGSTRSRHFKRGNEVMKRARSVEALLCEKSPWNTQRASYNAPPVSVSSGNHNNNNSSSTSSCVTIEDKIHNARERLHSGTDAAPPKRLTSIIDDTERPPPDLVKQTLKMFEATANRRPRPAQRKNGVGGVASKVANYKSIIKEQKPLSIPSALTPKPRSDCSNLRERETGTETAYSPMTMITQTLNHMQLDDSPSDSSGRTQKNQQTEATVLPTAGNSGGVGGTNQQRLMSRSPMPKYTHDFELASGAYVSTPKSRSDCTNLRERETGTETAYSPMSMLTQTLHHMRLDDSPSDSSGRGQKNQQTESTVLPVGGSSGVGGANQRLVTNENQNEGSHERNNDNCSHDDGDKNDNDGDNTDDDQRQHNDDATAGRTEAHSDAYANNNDGDGDDDDNDDDAYSGGLLGAAGPSQSSTNDKQPQSALMCETHASTEAETTAAAVAAGGLGGGIAIAANRQFVSANNSDSSTKLSSRILSAQTDHEPAKLFNITRPLYSSDSGGTGSSGSPSTLTSREIEKNRINEMKSTALNADAASHSGATSSSNSSLTSLDTVINTKPHPHTTTLSGTTQDNSETDASASPIWAWRKRRQPTSSSGIGGSAGSCNTEQTSMVFNFSKSTKEVPDYIESEVVIYRRKRELPKPNEPGFVLLGDLSVETSTDSDYDEYSMCPPSPCDVEFENANIVIDGKSSIRQKAKESSFRVQFSDTLTSTFEYPSESSLVIDDPPYADPYGNMKNHHQQLHQHKLQLLEEQQQQQQQQQPFHHHVTVDEIIELPTSTAMHNKTPPGSSTLGNLPLGSPALGFYTPMKGSRNLFQLGVTRYSPTDSSTSTPAINGNGTSNSNNAFNGNGSIVGITDGLINDTTDRKNAADDDDEAANVDYLSAASGVSIVYSEGTQKTDLLY
ncbi:uncharacterized protein LOC115628804 isoform X2 [Scaptodrosophila lebanonensis]|uniref:Uncharacterized protein LOC115628804 isoform X2 n=1 Tax=Drosophila lebanonensis TaxID=7225 RepID=A0A6J2U088_DROLE|nr:uncharacterized protein LOC115628804 isoform X2 [Scaptodrosophila lebanonensis]